MTKRLEQVKNEIDSSDLYNPKTIAKNDWMSDFQGKSTVSQYDYILKLIRAGRLKASNVGFTKKPRYRILGVHLIDYLEEAFGIKKIIKK